MLMSEIKELITKKYTQIFYFLFCKNNYWLWLNLQKLKNKIALSESEDKAAKEKLKEVLPELGKLRTRYLEPSEIF